MASVPREVTPDAIEDGFVPERGAGVHTVEVDGEAVLLNDGRLHLLNSTGSLVWACFDGDATIAEIGVSSATASGFCMGRSSKARCGGPFARRAWSPASVTPTTTRGTLEAAAEDGHRRSDPETELTPLVTDRDGSIAAGDLQVLSRLRHSCETV
jgi:hypothetical protein